MTEANKPTSTVIKHSEDARDKSRNEKQKAMLLRELVESRQQQKSAELLTSSEKIVARSKELCEQAKKLKSARTPKADSPPVFPR